MSEAAPVLVEVTRGALTESRHRGIVAVVDADGGAVELRGDVDRPVFARSAIKPLQALPLIETGTADAIDILPEELAIACASHGGEPKHVAVVATWLHRVGLSVADLECGAHPPSYAPAARALYAAGAEPTALHNNCSGKHAGMLAICRHEGDKTRGYIAPDHPQQQRVRRALSDMCGVDLSAAPSGIDGCSLPQYGIPLRALALGFARFGAPENLPTERETACRRIAAAMVAHPFMLAGTGRFCTRATEITNGKALLKTGAEGVYAAAIPSRGFGIALKIDDGATRAAEVAMAALLIRYAGLDEGEIAAFRALLMPPITNVAGREVGAISPVPGF